MSDEKQGWHLNKSVSISHILSTIVLAAALFSWGADVDKRIALVEHDVQRQDKTLADRLKSIESKLDAIIQREIQRGSGQ